MKQEKRLISGSASFLYLSIGSYKGNDGTGGGQKYGKLILYYTEKYYLSKVVYSDNYIYNCLFHRLVLPGILYDTQH